MCSQTASSPAAAPLSPLWLRWIVLAGLLLGEVLLLTLRFDSGTMLGQSGWWAALLRQSSLLLQTAIAAFAATLLLGGVALWDEWRVVSAQPFSFRRAGIALLVHLVIFAAFAGVTAVLLEGNANVLPKSVWTLLWLALGLATLGSWSLTVLPASLWFRLIRRIRFALLAGLGVGVLACGAGLLLRRCWLPLAEGTLWTVHFLLRLMYSDVICQPVERVVGTSTFAVEIAPQCSGYEGMGLLSVFVAVYLWLFRRDLRFPQALLLWPVGVAILWLANSLRIAGLIVIGTAGWPEVALGGFHSQAGWLAFNAVALGLAFIARRMRFFAIEPVSAPATPEVHPITAYLAPFLVILATTMITGAFTNGFDVFYPLRVLTAAAVLWLYRRAYGELRWSWSWQPFALGIVVFLLWIALVPSGIGKPSALRDGLARLSPGWAIAWLIVRVLGATITVPLAEELAFRGYLLRRLQSAEWDKVPPGRFSWFSLLVSSLLFGVLHGSWLAGTLAGVAYAVAVYRRGKLMDAVLAHATTNALLAGYVLATGSWALW
ncbi:MAG TPA: exosortase E/protease, VPEID-CTERM system [Gemmataceae bacterium]|nr:exosortase E/protease, VPEID-CTERM system [Gemmataceae bacterium]